MSWYNPSTWGHDIENAYNDTKDAVNSATGWVDDNIVEPTAHYATDAYTDTTKALTDAYNYSYSLAANPQATVATVKHNVTDLSSNLLQEGWNNLPKEYQDGLKTTEHYLEEGAEAVVKYGTEAYEWVSANACSLALGSALSTGVVLAFTYKGPEDPNQASIFSINGFALSAKAAAASLPSTGASIVFYGAAASIAYFITPVIYNIPGIKGQVSKDLLNSVITTSIANSMSVYWMLWSTPETVGAAIASIVIPVVTTLVCNGIAPKHSGLTNPSGAGGTFSHNSAKLTVLNRGMIEQHNFQTNNGQHVPVHRVTNGNYCNFMNNNSLWPTDNRATWEGSVKFNIPLEGYYTIAVACDNEVEVYVGDNMVLHWNRFDTTSQIDVWFPRGEGAVSWKASNYGGAASGKNPAGFSILMDSVMDNNDIKSALRGQGDATNQTNSLKTNPPSQASSAYDPMQKQPEPVYTTMPVNPMPMGPIS